MQFIMFGSIYFPTSYAREEKKNHLVWAQSILLHKWPLDHGYQQCKLPIKLKTSDSFQL